MDDGKHKLASSCTENAHGAHFKTELVDLVTKAHEKYLITTKSMKESSDYLKKMYQEVSTSYDIISEELVEDIKTMEKALQSTTQMDGYSSKAFNSLERLKVSLSAPSQLLMEVMAKSNRRQLTDVHKVCILIIIYQFMQCFKLYFLYCRR